MSERRAKRGWLWALLVMTLGLIAFSNYWKSSLKLKEIVIEGTRIVDKNELLQLSQVQTGTLLYDVDLTAVQKNVLSHHYVKDVTVERNLPSSIRVSITERLPLALVNGSEIKYLDEEGVVLPHSVSKALFDLPVLSGVPASVTMKLGSRIGNQDVQEALSILSTAKLVSRELFHLISEVQIRRGDIVLYSAEWGVPIIFGRGEAPAKLVRLETFWNEIVRERGAQNLQYVDLRYDDQVVVRWKM
ncbi:MAG: FtsQ-type POTRA domain-containing protein [Ignavibacteriales bacterium]|nr:FtsQ-type POTRA domain-containing protein [Ignavibacteriales bacterium]